MSESYDPALRTILEEVYGKYLKALAEKDYDGFLAITSLLKSGIPTPPKEDFELTAEMMSDFSPKLEETKLITIKQEGAYAGYYCYGDLEDQERVTVQLLVFKKESDTWKVRGDSYSNSVFKEGWSDDKLQEMLNTDPKFQLSTYDKEQSPDPAPNAAPAGETYYLTVSSSGQKFSVSLNGTEVFTTNEDVDGKTIPVDSSLIKPEDPANTISYTVDVPTPGGQVAPHAMFSIKVGVSDVSRHRYLYSNAGIADAQGSLPHTTSETFNGTFTFN